MSQNVLRMLGGVVLLILATLFVLLALGLPVGNSIGWLWSGSLGNTLALSRTLTLMTPLAFCGLGTLVAWRAGMFNIGGEGQFVMGGLCAAIVFKLCSGLPVMVLTPMILLASVVGGAAYAWLPGWLFVRRGVLVVISTILLNFVATHALEYAVNGPLKQRSGELPLTDRLPDAVMLTKFSPQTDLHVGVILAILVAIIGALVMAKTKFGLVVKAAGAGPRVLRALRIDAGKIQSQAMAVSGALCGLAGGVEYTALAGQLGESFSQNWGFLAIPVALLGGTNGAGILVSGFAFGALFAGTNHLSRFTQGGTSLVYIIQAVMLFVVLAWSARSSAAAASEATA